MKIHLRRYLIPHLGDVPLTSLTLDLVQAMYTAIAAPRRAAPRRAAAQPGHGQPIGPATVSRLARPRSAKCTPP